jgi:putative flippase GtrA
MTQDLLRSTVTRFLSVGFLNTVVGFTLIYGSKYFLGFGDVPANALGYGVGVLLSFTLNSTWTFSYQGPQLPALVRFLLAFAIAYTVNLLGAGLYPVGRYKPLPCTRCRIHPLHDYFLLGKSAFRFSDGYGAVSHCLGA